MSTQSSIGVIGAGPGGLMAALLLASRGHSVTIYEKSKRIGGRCAELVRGDYSWDLGPTFLIYKEILENCFKQASLKVEDYLDIRSLDPMYKLFFADSDLDVYFNKKALSHELEKKFPGAAAEFKNFMIKEKKRFKALKPCLERDFSSLSDYFSLNLIKALPHLGLGSTVMKRLRSSFSSDERALSFGFQAKYLGMSAWDCPSMFSILPYLEHEYGVHHVMGGLNKIMEALAKASKKFGAKIHLNTAVKEVLTEKGAATGVLLENGKVEKFDDLVLNADFAYSMTHLFKQQDLRKYKEKKLEKMDYSCSTFMLYLGLKRSYQLPFHSVVFAKDYARNVEEVFKKGLLSKDFSFYIRTPNQLDSSSAPSGHTAMYVLVPVPNLKIGSVDWKKQKMNYRDLVIKTIQKRMKIEVSDAIEVEEVVTPEDWQTKHNVHHGATFNLSHNWRQLAMFRPKNSFCDVKNVFLVGGGTHPGSGLPTIFESSRIAARLIEEKHGRFFESYETEKFSQNYKPVSF